MKKLWLCSLIFLGLGLWICSGRTVQAETADGTISPYALTVESLTDPVGIDAVAPRFAWKSRSVSPSAYNLSQSAYQILVASNPELLAEDNGDLWDSGKVKSFESLQIKYQGKTLKSSQRCYWKVRVWDQNDTVSEWSEPGFWIMGVVDPADWKAQWITQPESLRPEVDLEKASWIANSEKPADGNPPQYFRREFVIDQPQQMFEDQNLAGTLYFAGNQRFEIFVNGNKAGYSIGMVFNPDQLRSIDISEYLVAGRNTVAFVASPGDSKDPVAIIAKLTVQTLDKSNAPANLPQPNRFGKPADTILTLVSDDSWFVSVKGGDRWNQNDPDYLEKNKDNWNAAVALFGPDEGPWGKLRRRTEQVSPMFQRSFSVEKPVQSAILHITGAGLYEASLDGSKIGDKLLTPSFTRYDRRMLYSTYDLTDRFRNAENSAHELEVMVGHSWYDVRSIVTWNFDAAPWRDFPRMIAQLELTYEDGTSEMILSDSSWTCSNSPILFDCVRQGEIQQGNFNREILGQAVVVDAPKGKLSAEAFPATRITREFQVKSIRETAPGTCLVDLGANIAGWCRVCLPNAKPGDVIRFRYSERILEDGSIERHDIAMHFMEGTPAWMTGMKGEFQTDFYFCKGDGTDVFEPKFTYNGFQYLEIVGLREVPAVKDITACVLNTDFAPRASFDCSNELYNKIQAATLSSYCANFVAGYPTDCPHREKNGWTGDAHLAAEQAMYNWENTASYEKWVQDLCDEQNEEG
ncbi:MAG: family 78 glycoside hydrolase catalytic domain, partial [Thermoguttaceae bacterium]|nr:family 78 glycoside hydrolase catalytic domain [Thermoguttaceae bacterium]